MTNSLNTTQWDNSAIYKSFEDPELKKDFEEVSIKVKEVSENLLNLKNMINEETATLAPSDEILENVRNLARLELDLTIKTSTMGVFASTAMSVNAKNVEAKNFMGKFSSLRAEFGKTFKPLQIFLSRVSDAFIDEFLKDDRVSELKFSLEHERKMRHHLLSPSEEILASGLSQDGLHSWGKLYSSLAGSMKIAVGEEEVGLAQAASLLREGDREKRKLAYEGINKAWSNHEEAVSSILNSLNGWRNEMNKARSHTKELHYLDVSCQQNHIVRKTLDSLMEETYNQRDIGHRALRGMAKMMGVEKLGPYDLIAPAPLKGEGEVIPFDKAIDLIAEAFSELNPEMGDFAYMMAKNNWIDATPSENRGSGAHCTKFVSRREPRVFITYTGSMGNVITLAHELGHAYHNWVMRDLPLTETYYSMSTAETASIFAETLVKKSLLEKAQSKEDRLKILWQDAESAAALMINIPARFEFEKNLIESRKERPQSPDEMREMMKGSWKKWYEDT
ncbi:MAG: M3 family metallopeptidase, partial [Halobacteriovoraceae bacterium]|nr:M3 family metallopeptidase [Halobacteriovoraceae bacterium]